VVGSYSQECHSKEYVRYYCVYEQQITFEDEYTHVYILETMKPPNVFIHFQVIAADGELKASRNLKEAADVLSQSPSSLQLRYLQTLHSISAEKNSTIIFPLPIDLLSQTGLGKKH